MWSPHVQKGSQDHDPRVAGSGNSGLGYVAFLRRCVAPAEFDADFVQPCFQRAIEFVISGGQRVGQLLDAACTKNDGSYCRIRQQPSD